MKNPIIIKCRLVPKGLCINLFSTLWTSDTSWIDRYVVNHERIHTAQQRELLFIPFYVLYVIEWLYRITVYRNFRQAYMNISFEREAYANDRNLGYLGKRKLFSWTKYLKKRKVKN